MKGNLRKVVGLLLVALMALFAAAPAPAARAANPNPGVIPPQARPYGHTYAEWSNMWWQWANSIPMHDANGNVLSPVIDETGAKCGVGQSGHVWFLVTVPVIVPASYTHIVRTLTCTVPTGKALFFPLYNGSNDNYSQDPSAPCYPRCYTLDQLRTQMEGFLSSLNGCPDCSVEVDGRSVTGIFGDADRIGYGNTPYSVAVPEDNIYQYLGFPVPAQTVYPQISDGWYVMHAPLSAGQHMIHVHTALPDVFEFDVTYYLTVGN